MARRYGGAYNSARRHGWVDQLKYNNHDRTRNDGKIGLH